MRACLQRVTEAAVAVRSEHDERVVGRIGCGIVALVGFAAGDDDDSLTWIARKIPDLRIFAGASGSFDRSLREIDGGLLIVSQFTLYGDARKGRRPDFAAAAGYDQAKKLYERFCTLCMEALPQRVETGDFGADMAVRLVNDGPVTLWLER